MTDTNRNGDSGGLYFDDEIGERYLFGELTEAEQERFETAYFVDDAFFERFLAVKNELLDLYARGELDAAKRARMERNFLATAPRRKKIAESGDFIRAVTEVSARTATADGKAVAGTAAPGWIDSIAHFFTLPRLAGASILLLAALGGTWMFLRSNGSDVEQAIQQPFPANSAQENREREVISDGANTISPPSNETASPETASAPKPQTINPDSSPDHRQEGTKTNQPVKRETVVAASNENPAPKSLRIGPAPTSGIEIGGQRTEYVTLEQVASRDVRGKNTIRVLAGTQNLGLRLALEGSSYRSYSARVATIEGTVVWRKTNIKTPTDGAKKTVTLLIPAAVLNRKDYIVTITGHTSDEKAELIQEHYFHIERTRTDTTATDPPRYPLPLPPVKP